MLYGETGRFPLDITIKSRMTCYWFSCINNEQSKLSYIVYKLMLILHNTNTINCNWVSFIHQTLNNLGISNVWLLQAQGVSFNWLKCKVNRMAKDHFLQEWSTNVYNSSKCLNYRIFKTSHIFENYLVFLPQKYRKMVTKFRCRNNRMPVEIGSYTGVVRELRFCDKCNEQQLGDEFHYLLYCIVL